MKYVITNWQDDYPDWPRSKCDICGEDIAIRPGHEANAEERRNKDLIAKCPYCALEDIGMAL